MSVGDRPLVRESYPLYERAPTGFSCRQSGMTNSEGDARMRLSATGDRLQSTESTGKWSHAVLEGSGPGT